MRRFLYCLACAILLLASLTDSVSSEAAGRKEENYINVDSLEDIGLLYSSEDGVYKSSFDDGSEMTVIITSEDVPAYTISSVSSTTKAQYKSHKYIYNDTNGNKVFESETKALFHFDGSYVWCTEGTVYITGGSYKINKNTYSSKKVTGYSYYTVSVELKTSDKTYKYLQSIGSDPTGKADTLFKWL